MRTLASLAALTVALSLPLLSAADKPVPEGAAPWATVKEDEFKIRIETDHIEAAIPKSKPKQWMTGIEKQSFYDKKTGSRELGDGLMVVDWLMEAGSDEAYADKLKPTDRYRFGEIAHGSSHRKRMVEGPQLCPWMKPVKPEVIRGKDFVAVTTTYNYEYGAPGKKAGSKWTQRVVFPKGERWFVLMDRIDTVNDSEEMFLRNDTPGCVRHAKGENFSEMYLSYLSGPKGVTIPASEFVEPFPPDRKFNYRRDTHKLPKSFIRAYHTKDVKTGKPGAWLAGITLDPDVVYEAWASMRPGIIVMIEEVYGRPIKAGGSFSAAHVVGWFDTVEEMHAVAEKYKGMKTLEADAKGWKLGR